MKYKEEIFSCIQYIETNIKEKLTAEGISKKMGYSIYHFSRIFSEQMGVSLMESDEEIIIVGLLHDIIEEKTIVTLKEIEESFSLTVGKMLNDVTNFNNKYSDITDEEAFDDGVIMIKLADRLHNMRTIEFMEPQRWREKAKETVEIFSPIAAKFNNSKLKAELDNLALKYV